MLYKKTLSILAFALWLSSLGSIIAKSNSSQKSDSIRAYKTETVNVSSSVAKERISPVPMTEISSTEIEQYKSNLDLPLLLNRMQSVMSYSENGNGIGYSNMTIRGFDQRRISVYVNGIPQNDPEDHNMYWINLSDISESASNIQVQRGAGFSSYGSPAMAGSVNLTTSNFAGEPGIKLETGVGYQQFDWKDEILANTSKFKAEFQSGLIDNKYAIYGKLSRLNSVGYRDQSWGQFTSWFLGAARYDDNFTTQINIFGGKQDDGLAYNGIPKFHVKDDEMRVKNYSYVEQYDTDSLFWGAKRRSEAVEQFSQPHFELLNDWYINDNLTFKSSLFYYEGEGYFDYSGAGWTDNSSFGISDTLPELGNTLIRGFVSNKQGGWIPRIIWNHGKSNINNDKRIVEGSGELTIGAEIRLHRSEHWSAIEYAENIPANYKPFFKFSTHDGQRDIFSLFAREQYYLFDDLSVNAEAQLVYHRYGMNNVGLHGNLMEFRNIDNELLNSNGEDLIDYSYLFFNPRFGVNYLINDEMNVYSSFAITSREPRMKYLYNAGENWGGENPQFNSITDTLGNVNYDFDDPYVKPERMTDIELGFNYIKGNNKFNINLYYMNFENEFVKSGQLDIYGAPIVANADGTQHFGLEIGGQYEVLDGLALWVNLTLSSNKITDMNYIAEYNKEVDSVVVKITETVSLKDNNIAGFSDILSSFGLSYSYNSLFLNVYGKFVGDMRTDNFGDLLTENEHIRAANGPYDNTVDAYMVLNANASFNLKDLIDDFDVNLKFFINNILNEKYAAFGSGSEFFVGAERNFYLGIEYKM